MITNIGRVDNEPIHVDTNIHGLNPMIASAMLLPIVDYKDAKKVWVPYEPNSAIAMTHAYENFYQFMIKGPAPAVLGLAIDWDDRIQYEKPKAKEGIALKMDGMMSVFAYHKFKGDNIETNPFVVTYTKSGYQNIKDWLRRSKITDAKPILIDYGNFNEKTINMVHYENWIASSIVSTISEIVWLAIPKPEISNYFPDRTFEMFDGGSNWLSKCLERRVVIESPFEHGKTRIQIIEELKEELDFGDSMILNSIRCSCGKCFECFMNYVVLDHFGLDPPDGFPDKFKSTAIIKRIKKLIELEKLNPSFVEEISDFIGV